MLNPYRRSASTDREARDDRWDDYVLGTMLIVLSGWRVVLALVENERFTTEPTIAAVMTGLGFLILLSALTRRR